MEWTTSIVSPSMPKIHKLLSYYGMEIRQNINVEIKKVHFLWNGTGRIVRGLQTDILRYLKEN